VALPNHEFEKYNEEEGRFLNILEANKKEALMV